MTSRTSCAAALTAVAMFAASCGGSADVEAGATTTTAVATTTPPTTTTTTTTAPPPTTTTIDLSGPPVHAELNLLIAHEGGVSRIAAGVETPVPGISGPVAVAFEVQGSVVWQPADPDSTAFPPARLNAIYRTTSGSTEVLLTDLDTAQRFELLDATLTEAGPRAVIGRWTNRWPDPPTETAQVLNLSTLGASDLVEVEGFRAGIVTGRFTPDGVAVVVDDDLVAEVQHFDLAGTPVWSTRITTGGALTSHTDGTLALVNGRLLGAGFVPTVSSSRFDGEDGVPVPDDVLELTLRGPTLRGTFCLQVDIAAGVIICDRSDGGPIAIDTSTGLTDEIRPGSGRASLVRG